MDSAVLAPDRTDRTARGLLVDLFRDRLVDDGPIRGRVQLTPEGERAIELLADEVVRQCEREAEGQGPEIIRAIMATADDEVGS